VGEGLSLGADTDARGGLKHYMPVETLSYLPNVEKVNSHTIRFIGEDMIEISKFLRVATGYRVDMQP
jgi:D-aminopeptidase